MAQTWKSGQTWDGWYGKSERYGQSKWEEKTKWNDKSWEDKSWNRTSGTWSWKSHEPSAAPEVPETSRPSLSEEDLLVAVQACYLQEVYPQDVLLLWMLKGYKNVTLEEIQSAALSSSALQVEYSSTSKKGFAVLMEIPPLRFTGFADDATDTVAVELVEEAAMLVLKGGWPVPEQSNHDRISIAAWLHSSEVLQHLTLGKCLAVVNLLLASHSVLGKKLGRLVPYFHSEEYEKQENAKQRRPTSLREEEVWVSRWEDLVGYLKVLLKENGGQMMSARVKNEMRARFNLEFSETALGHVSLGSLLDDPRFLEHFRVRKAPPAADLIQLKDGGWKEPICEPKWPGAFVLAQLPEKEKQKRCFDQLISTGPCRQELLLPLPCQPWEILSDLCKKAPARQPTACALEEV